MKIIIFEHLKEDMTLTADRNQTKATNIDFFFDAGKQFEKFSLFFFKMQSISIQTIRSQRWLLTLSVL